MQAGIKLALGSGKEGATILKLIERRTKELKKPSRNAYIVDLIKMDLTHVIRRQQGDTVPFNVKA